MHGGMAIARVVFDETKVQNAARRMVNGERDGGGESREDGISQFQ